MFSAFLSALKSLRVSGLVSRGDPSCGRGEVEKTTLKISSAVDPLVDNNL